MPMSFAEVGEKLVTSLEDGLMANREVGMPDIGAATVTVTFKKADGGMDFFTLIETVMSGG